MGTKTRGRPAKRRKKKLTPGYAILADMSRCSNCGACVLACKEYNDYPVEETGFTPSGVNPPDVSQSSVITMHAFESEILGRPYSRFQRVSCYHCRRAACHEVCPVKGCIWIEPTTKAVIIREDRCASCRFCVHACPFQVPRMGKHPAAKDREVAIKCNLCWDRLKEGRKDEKIPACAKACPTGALVWGERNNVVGVADGRLAVLKTTFAQEGGRQYMQYGKDEDVNLGGMGVFFILEQGNLDNYMRLPKIPRVPASVASWKGFFRWSAAILPGIVVVFAFLHYLIFGPLGVHVVEEEEEKSWDEMTPEEQADLIQKREREIKAKRKAGKAQRLYQPMPARKEKRIGKGKRGRPPTRKRRR